MFANRDALPLVMMAATSWLQAAMSGLKANGRRGLLVDDEVWALLESEQTARHLQARLKLCRDRGIANILVTHRLSDLRTLADAIRLDGDERREAWVASLPAAVARLERAWSVDVGAPFQPGGQTAWVAPARTASGDDVVLKLAWWHPEADREAAGLGVWDGDGAIRVYASDRFDGTVALLVERCVPGTPLMSRSEREQDTVIATLLQRLWRDPPPGHRFRPLQQMCDAWADEFEQQTAVRPVDLDPGLVRDGIILFRTLPATTERHVLLCTDLHAGNVLAAEREPWLMIDPKPHVGDPHYDVVQHLLNCDERLHADPRGLARRMADLAGLDRDRLLLWLFARCVQQSPDWPAPLTDIARRIAPT